MATRMQQRRGTATQWTTANPILAAGEIGFETNTNKFKIGDGVNTWSALNYFANSAALTDLLDGAPDALNTLNELAAAIGDDAAFFTTVQNELDLKAALTDLQDHLADSTGVHGIEDTSLLATKLYADSAVSAVIGTAAANLDTLGEIASAINNDADFHTTISNSLDSKQDKVTNVSDTEIGYLDGVTSGIQSQIDAKASSTDLSNHASDTTSIHGIADTSLLATTTGTETLTNKTIALGSNTVSGTTAEFNTAITDGDFATLAGTETLTNKTITSPSGLVKGDVGLGNVDNTSDANKPVSDDTQDALDLKANLAGPTFTGTVTTDDLIVEGDLTVSGTTTTINATDLSITDPLIYLASNQYTEDVLDVGFLAATGAPGGTEEDHLHSGFFRDASDSKKWKLVSNVPHPVANVVDITNATKETLVVGSLEATTVTPSSGVVFSDGTQTKEGVPSRTPIVQKTASYSLSTLTHRDSLIEVSSTDATTITIPEDATVNYPIGTTIDILQTNTGQVTIAPVSGSVTVNATPGLKLRTRWSSATLMKRAANTWVVYGDLTA
jgi:hypothetical protein